MEGYVNELSGFRFKRGDRVFILRKKEVLQKVVEEHGDHLGFFYEEKSIVAGYQWEIMERCFCFSLLDQFPVNMIFSNRAAAEFKKLRLERGGI